MIPVSEPVFAGKEFEYLSECLSSGWISSSGRFINEFETAWARECDRKYGIAVSNGTVALELAVSCLDLQPGDEIIMPSFTIISTALASVYNNASPVLVDADPDTWCMDVSQIQSRITDRTRAIMPVHIYGHPADMDPILDLAHKHQLAIIEDAAEAHGGEYLHDRAGSSPEWRKCGSFGEFSAFSFYANKLITTGEGGMVLTDSADLADRARSRRNLCFGREHRFLHTALGYNFRMTNMQAAIGLAQVEQLPQALEKKRWIGRSYTERLIDLETVSLQTQQAWAATTYWMFGLVVDPATGLDAAAVSHALEAKGIQTRPFFTGMHEQPALLERGLFANEHHPVTSRLSQQGIYLPSGLSLTEGEIDIVCDGLRSVTLK